MPLTPSQMEAIAEEFLHDDTPFEAVLDGSDEVAEFIRLVRADEATPMDLAARLMEQGIDVEALEASIHH